MNMGKAHSGLWKACLALACVQSWAAAAGEVKQVRLDAGPTGTQAEIRMAGAGGFTTLNLSDPARLVVDLPASSAVRGLSMPVGTGLVKSVRTGHPVPGTLRIVFDLAAPVMAPKPRMEQVAGESRLLIEWPGDGPATAVAGKAPVTPAVPAPVPAAPSVDLAEASRATAVLSANAARQAAQAPSPQAILNGQVEAPSSPSLANNTARPTGTAVSPAPGASVPAAGNPVAAAVTAPPVRDFVAEEPKPLPIPPALAARAGLRPLVIAIDPGHGGQDPGAIGPTGKQEKNVTLAIGRELARQINATPGLKAYMTRDTDVFIPLPMRAKLARAAKADMFISIHADSAENRSATGSSVFVLSTKGASSQRARWLADKENSADLVGGVRLQKTDNTLASVLIDLAQSGHMKASEDVAGRVLNRLGRVGDNHKSEIERANFAVLRTSDMPAMLVETAFISNPDEERRLTSPDYQRQLASAVLGGVNDYFTRQPPPGTMYAARAQADAAAASGGRTGGGSP